MTPTPARDHKVVVIGSITCDLTTFSTRLPKPGETILGDGFSMVLGGKGANQAIAASRTRSDVHMVGCVGNDLFKDLVLDSLNAENIDTTAVLSVEGPTGIAHIQVDASAENDIVMVPLANASLDAEHVRAALGPLGRPGDVALIQLEIPHATAVAAARMAHAAGMTVVLDPAPAPAAPLDEALWAAVDIVTPNETEARLITGINVTDAASAAEAGRWFTSRGTGRAIITLAGALRQAMAAGALAVTVAGASPSIPTLAAIDGFLAAQQ